MSLKSAMAGRTDTSGAAAASLPSGAFVVVAKRSLVEYTKGLIYDAGGRDDDYHYFAVGEIADAELIVRNTPTLPRTVFITDGARAALQPGQIDAWMAFERRAVPQPPVEPRALILDNPLRPIDASARDGTTYLIFDPKQRPPVVAAYWMTVTEGDDVVWSGWTFADEVLADLYPAELEPTHFMAMPEPALPRAPKQHVHPRGQLADMTFAQRDAADRAHALRFEVTIRSVEVTESVGLDAITRGDVFDEPDFSTATRQIRCPVVKRDHLLNAETVVLPDGSLMTVQGITR